jgi:putative MATE family efflux protein
MAEKLEKKGEIPSSKDAYKRLSVIGIPSVVEMVFMSLIGSVDTIMIGKLGYGAIAAVGLAGQPRMLTLSLFFALNVGITAVVARRKGEGKRDEANRALKNALMLSLSLSAIVTALSLWLSGPLLLLAGAKDETIVMSTSYFRILTYFMPVSCATMCINAAQRGTGNTRVTLYVNIAANLTNVVFNYLLIYGKFGFPELGVEGAAWASGIGLSVGLVLCVISLFQRKLGGGFLSMSLKDNWRLSREAMASIAKVGGNAMVEQIAIRVGFFAYAAIVANLGTESFAAHQVGMQFLGLSFTFGDGLAVAGTSMVGQMLGQGRPDLAAIYAKCSQRLALCASLLIASVVIIFRFPLVEIFLDGGNPENAAPIAIAAQIMILVAVFQPVQMQSVVSSGCLRGAGDNLYVAMVMIICVVMIRPVFSLLAINALGLGLAGAWSASLVDMCIRLSLMLRRTKGTAWLTKKV